MSLNLNELAASVEGLSEAVRQLLDDAPTAEELNAIVERGEFRPAENEAIGYWFARFLTIRDSLWQSIDDVVDTLGGVPTSAEGDLKYFVPGYASVCLLVGIDRRLLFDVASHSIVQRKLNEPFAELRIPRKQFTGIFEAFVDERNALTVLDAMKFAKRHRKRIEALREDPVVGRIAASLPELEMSLNPSKRAYLRGALAYVSHKWRRRGVVSVNNVLAGVVEGVGRVASDIYVTDNKRVSDTVREEIGALLEPGDVLVTRHAIALTNLFMPGFWPHAALYVGTDEQRNALGVVLPDEGFTHWSGPVCTLEALKDGVRLRALENTLSVDCFVVLRPRLPATTIRRAIERAVVHEGKRYNFDFDFFSSDRLVCTEVIYRAYDGLDGIRIPLTERAGRKTLSAEDLLSYALDAGTFDVVAVFGIPTCEKEIAFEAAARELLAPGSRPKVQDAVPE